MLLDHAHLTSFKMPLCEWLHQVMAANIQTCLSAYPIKGIDLYEVTDIFDTFSYLH